MDMSMVTIYDIAKKANVSPATVSLVLHQDARVNHMTRSKIEKIILKSGYHSRKITRKPKLKPLGDILVYCPFDFTKSSRPSILDLYTKEICASIVKKGGTPITIIGGESKQVLQHFLPKNEVAGAIIYAIDSDDSFYLHQLNDLSKNTQTPVVIVGDQPAFGQYDFVSIHNFNAGRIAADHFIENIGAQEKFGVVHLNCLRSWDQERLRGFITRIQEKSSFSPEIFLYDPAMSEKDHLQLAKKISASGVKGIFATNHWIDIDCAKALFNIGVEVGKSLQIIGFSHETISIKDKDILLHYIDFSIEDLINSAVDILISRQNRIDPSEISGKLMPVRLILQQNNYL